MSRNFTRKLSTLILLVPLLAGISGCDDNFQDIKNWFDSTASLGKTALYQAEITPYRDIQHQALKNYFSGLMQMALAAKNDAKFAGRLNTALSKSDINSVCGKLFISKTRWQAIVDRCTRNRFFLCAEEVRSYPDMVQSLRTALTLEQRKRFDRTSACTTALD